MSYTSAVLADSPNVLYLLDETTGTTLVDASPNGRNGVYDSSLPSKGSSLVPNDPGQCNAYTGTGKTAHVSYGAWLTSSALTLSFWYKTSYAPGAASNIMVRLADNTSVVNTYGINLIVGGYFRLAYYNTAGGFDSGTNSNTPINDGLAHHLAASISGSTVKYYIDGALDRTQTGSSGIYTGTNGQGSLSLTDDVTHSLDSVAHWGTALSDAQIAAHYAATVPDPLRRQQSALSRNGALMQRAFH